MVLVDTIWLIGKGLDSGCGWGGFEELYEEEFTLEQATRRMNDAPPPCEQLTIRKLEAHAEVLLIRTDLAAHARMAESCDWLEAVLVSAARKLTFLLQVIAEMYKTSDWEDLWRLADFPESRYVKSPYKCFIRRYILDWMHTFPERIAGQKAAVIARSINHESVLIRVKEARHNGAGHHSVRVLTHSADWTIASVLRLYPCVPNTGPLPDNMCWRASQLGGRRQGLHVPAPVT